MNRSNFILTGGYPLKAERLQELQTASSIFNAFGALAGNLTIISGCILTGSIVGDGFVYIDGELLDFREGTVKPSSTVIIIEEAVNRGFKNGTVKQVHTIRYATFGTADTSWLWSEFKRPIETKTIAEWQMSVINRLSVIETKLATIQSGAQVNLPSDILYKGSILIGDTAPVFGGMGKRTVITFPNVGTTAYSVQGSLRSVSSLGWDNDSGVFWTWELISGSSFAVITREIDNRIQDQVFEFVLIKK
jgi:hypothetical protein